jgi:Mg2+ and Co2+ transporter CorA|tara:strand:+ start:552 stop:758 length:207 start_codon:yes stop_codon:yes gene_type:complete
MEEMKEILKKHNTDAKNYLLDFIEKNEEGYTSIHEYEDAVGSLHDEYYVRIYDLAIYNLTNELLQKIK